MINLKILDHFKEGDAVCVLGKTSLEDFIRGIPHAIEDYYIQRGLVSNRYLDKLWDTIAKKSHIPQIVLVSNSPKPADLETKSIAVSDDLKILDGLQRTQRLKVIWSAVLIVDKMDEAKLSIPTLKLTRQYISLLEDINCPASLFSSIIKTKKEKPDQSLLELFKNKIWLEIWFDLPESQQIKKMLILNAGHKAVNIKHQIELLFFGYLNILESQLPGKTIYREKERSATSYSKKREAGEFHFSHLISAFESLNSGKPVTTNSEFSANKSFKDDDEEILNVDTDTIGTFAQFLLALDIEFSDRNGVSWLSREVILVGLFAAIGRHALNENLTFSQALKMFSNRLHEFREVVNLEGFERERNNLELSKVNIGSKNKSAVFNAVKSFLEGKISGEIDWKDQFISR